MSVHKFQDRPPLNNLDLFDAEAPQTTEDLFDLPFYEPTLEEQYADAEPEALDKLMFDGFFDGFTEYVQTPEKTRRLPTSPYDPAIKHLSPDQRLVAGSQGLIIEHMLDKSSRPRPGMQMHDRLQNANLCALKATARFDPEVGVSFFRYIEPFLWGESMRPEFGSDPNINEGPLMRVPAGTNKGYYEVDQLRYAKAYCLEKEFDPIGLPDVDPKSIENYRELRVEHQPLQPDGPEGYAIDEDPAIDPVDQSERAVSLRGVRNVLGMLPKQGMRDVLIHRMGLDGEAPLSRTEIQEKFGYTDAVVSRTRQDALGYLARFSDIAGILSGELEPVFEITPKTNESVEVDAELEKQIASLTREILDGESGVLKGLRLSIGITNKQVAIIAEMNDKTLNHLIRGTKNMSAAQAARIIDSLDKLTEFFGATFEHDRLDELRGYIAQIAV